MTLEEIINKQNEKLKSKNVLEFDGNDTFYDDYENMNICKSLDLIKINSKLSLLELRLIDMYLAKINPRDARFQVVSFTKRDFEILFNIKRVKTEDLKKALLNLEMMQIFTVKTKKDGSCICITLETTKQSQKYMFNLKQYCKYTLNDVRDLARNDYILFQYFMSKQKMEMWKVKVDDLKEILGVEDKYNEFYSFEKLIKSTLKIIKEKQNIEIKYTKVKKNHRIYYLKFEKIDVNHQKSKKRTNKKENIKEVDTQNEKLEREEYKLVLIQKNGYIYYSNNEEYEENWLEEDPDFFDLETINTVIEMTLEREKKINKKVIYNYNNYKYYRVFTYEEYERFKNENSSFKHFNEIKENDIYTSKQQEELENEIKNELEEERRLEEERIEKEQRERLINEEDDDDEWLPFS